MNLLAIPPLVLAVAGLVLVLLWARRGLRAGDDPLLIGILFLAVVLLGYYSEPVLHALIHGRWWQALNVAGFGGGPWLVVLVLAYEHRVRDRHERACPSDDGQDEQ